MRSFGRTIVDRQLRFASASSTTTAAGCAKAFAFEKLEGKPRPSSKGQIVGTQYHAEVAQYHDDGDVARLSSRLQAVLQTFPVQDRTNPTTFANVPIVPRQAFDVPAKLEDAPVKIDGVPFIGEIDLLSYHNGILVINDYKFVKDFRFILTPFKLAHDIQMTVYGLWSREEEMILRHTYVRTEGKNQVQEVEIKVTRERLEHNAETLIKPVIKIMKAVAASPSAEVVPGNSERCASFSGCAHRTYCSVGIATRLDSIFGANKP